MFKGGALPPLDDWGFEGRRAATTPPPADPPEHEPAAVASVREPLQEADPRNPARLVALALVLAVEALWIAGLTLAGWWALNALVA